MFFFKHKKADSNQPKMRSTMGVLLDPGLGRSMRSLRETTSVFVNLLALIFANQGLFPVNHPALRGDPSVKLTLAGVIGTAWRNLVFSKQTIPQVILFFAILASLGFAVLAVVLFLFSLLVGKAHAQATLTSCSGYGYFAPCDPSQDIALGWLNYIFNGQPMYNYLGQYGQIVPQSSVIQQALISVLAFYSDAILVVAAVILFYHLASMVVETAHHGQVMGKNANQVWAPIRLVLAIGLLVPIMGGLNSGQYMVIQIAKWGSNLASQAWSVFVTNLAADSYMGVNSNAPYVQKTVYDTIMSYACMCAYNYGAMGSCSSGCAPPTTPNAYSPLCVNDSNAQGLSYAALQNPLSDGSTKFVYDFQSISAGAAGPNGTPPADYGVCGSVIFPPVPTSNDPATNNFQQQLAQSAQTAFQSMQQQVQNFVQTNIVYFIPSNFGGQQGVTPIPLNNNGQYKSIIDSYQTQLQQAISSSTDFTPVMQQVAATSSSQGWVSAGAWFNTVARVQSQFMDVNNLRPGTQLPQINPRSNQVFQGTALQVMNQFEDWMETEQPVGAATAGAAASQSGSQQQQLLNAAAGFRQMNDNRSGHLMDKIFMLVDWFAAKNGVWTTVVSNGTPINGVNTPNLGANNLTPQNFTLGVQFLSASPLAEIAYFGHANINAAYDIFDELLKWLEFIGVKTDTLGAGSKVIPSSAGILLNIANEFGVGVKDAVASILSLICLIFFASGVMLAYFLPLIPFLRFLFNVLTWIVSLLEAVIAVPLVALAHLNPAGDGLPGASAKGAYFFIFNIFLRPVLMVFGLIVGLLIFFVAASMMNMLYLQAVAGTGGLATGHLFMSRFIYSMLYVFVLFMCANSAFHMIDVLPEHAMQWLGANGLQYKSMGDPESIQTPMALISTYGEQQVLSGVSRLGGGGAFAARQALGGRQDLDKVPGEYLDKALGEAKAGVEKFVPFGDRATALAKVLGEGVGVDAGKAGKDVYDYFLGTSAAAGPGAPDRSGPGSPGDGAAAGPPRAPGALTRPAGGDRDRSGPGRPE